MNDKNRCEHITIGILGRIVMSIFGHIIISRCGHIIIKYFVISMWEDKYG